MDYMSVHSKAPTHFNEYLAMVHTMPDRYKVKCGEETKYMKENGIVIKKHHSEFRSVFEIFEEETRIDSKTLREGFITYVEENKEILARYCNPFLAMNHTNLQSYLMNMKSIKATGDELTLFVLGLKYSRHITVIQKTRNWLTRVSGSLYPNDLILIHHGDFQFCIGERKESEKKGKDMEGKVQKALKGIEEGKGKGSKGQGKTSAKVKVLNLARKLEGPETAKRNLRSGDRRKEYVDENDDVPGTSTGVQHSIGQRRLPRSAKEKANKALGVMDEEEEDFNFETLITFRGNERQIGKKLKWKIGKGSTENRNEGKETDIRKVNVQNEERRNEERNKGKESEVRKSARLIAKVLQCTSQSQNGDDKTKECDSDATEDYDYVQKIQKGKSSRNEKRAMEQEESLIRKENKKKKTECKKKNKKGVLNVVLFALKKRKVVKKQKYYLKCTLCNQVFHSSPELRTHTLTQHPLCKFLCRKCKKEFTSYAGLQRHNLETHKPKKFNCQDCRKTFSFKHQLVNHQRVHANDRPYSCSFQNCGADFTSVKARNTHVATFHVEGQNVKCLDVNCDLLFKSERSMKEHFRGQHGPGWTCICGNHFTAPATYTRHKRKCEEAQKEKEKKMFNEEKE